MRAIFRASTGRRTRFTGRFRSKPLPDSAESSRNVGPITIGFRNHRGRKPRPQSRSLVGRVRHSSRGGQGSSAKDEPSGQPPEHALSLRQRCCFRLRWPLFTGSGCPRPLQQRERGCATKATRGCRAGPPRCSCFGFAVVKSPLAGQWAGPK